MAEISNYFTGDIGTPSGTFRLKVEYSYTQSIKDNTTTLNVKGYVRRLKSSVYPYNTASVKLTIGDRTFSYSPKYNLNDNDYHLIATATNIKIKHNTDGTKSVNIKLFIDGNLSQYYPYGSVSKNITLAKIPRASKITLSKSMVDIGSSFTVYTNRQSSNFTHTVTLSMDGVSTITKRSVGSSVLFTIDQSWASAISGTSKTATVSCTTYNGAVKIDPVSTRTITIKKPSGGGGGSGGEGGETDPPDELGPIIDSVKVEPDGYKDLNAYNRFGGYVQGQTKLKFTVTYHSPLGVNLSSVKLYNKNVGSYTATTNSSGDPLGSSGTAIFSGIPAEDSWLRGSYVHAYDINNRHSTLAESKFTDVIHSYSPPSISSFQAYRSNSSGIPSDKSTAVYVSFDYDSLAIYNGGSNANSVSYTIESRPLGGNWSVMHSSSAYSSSGTITYYSGNTYSSFPLDTTYEFRATISDYFTTRTNSSSVGTEEVLLEFNASGKGISIGKVSELSHSFELALPIAFNNVQYNGGDNPEYLLSVNSGYGYSNLLNFSQEYSSIGTQNQVTLGNDNANLVLNGLTDFKLKTSAITIEAVEGDFSANMGGIDFTAVNGNTELSVNKLTLRGELLYYPRRDNLFAGVDITLREEGTGGNEKLNYIDVRLFNQNSGINIWCGEGTEDAQRVIYFGYSPNLGKITVLSPAIANHVASYSGNVVISDKGTLAKATSSIRYKQDVVTYDSLVCNGEMYDNSGLSLCNTNDIAVIMDEVDSGFTVPVQPNPEYPNPYVLYDLNVVSYKYQDRFLDPEDENIGRNVIGFIAEEIDEKMPSAVMHNKDGEADSWDTQKILASAVYLIQQQKKELNDLYSKIDQLNNHIAILDENIYQLKIDNTIIGENVDTGESDQQV